MDFGSDGTRNNFNLKKWIDIGRKMHVGDVVPASEDNVPRG